MNTSPANDSLPFAQRGSADLPGHWLLARLGKRVLRPGGRALTEQLLTDCSIPGSDVVELAPGLGRTAHLILDGGPRSYTGVEEDSAAAALAQDAVGSRGEVLHAGAEATGLPTACADVVIGEAMLTMQSDRGKASVLAEARRVLRVGGRYAIHELALEPDTLSEDEKTEIRRSLAQSIKVNARPLTTAEWQRLLQEHGFEVHIVRHAPMALLRPSRLVADEGLRRTAKFILNTIRDTEARRRVLAMRRTFSTYRRNLTAIELIAVKRDPQ